MGGSAQKALEGLMELMGWQIAEQEKKRLPFARTFAPLGVVVELDRADVGIVTIKNKEERLEELRKSLDEYKRRDGMTQAEAESLCGRLVFTEQFFCGKCGLLAMRVLRKWAKGFARTGLSQEMRWALDWIKYKVLAGRPRVIQFGEATRPILVFTDGAVEGETVTMGGVLIDGTIVEAFGCDVPVEYKAAWREHKQDKQCIGQAEVLPVAVAKRTWSARLKGRRALYFIDKDSARYALIAMASPVMDTMRMLQDVAELDLESCAINWYARVPSAANVADGPSRLKFDEVLTLGGVMVEPVVGKPMEDMARLVL